MRSILAAALEALNSLTRAAAVSLDRDSLWRLNERLRSSGKPTIGRIIRAIDVYYETESGLKARSLEAAAKHAQRRLGLMPIEAAFRLPALPVDPPETLDWLAGRISTTEWLRWASNEKSRWREHARQRRAAELLAEYTELSTDATT